MKVPVKNYREVVHLPDVLKTTQCPPDCYISAKMTNQSTASTEPYVKFSLFCGYMRGFVVCTCYRYYFEAIKSYLSRNRRGCNKIKKTHLEMYVNQSTRCFDSKNNFSDFSFIQDVSFFLATCRT
jgi:hypothetical protein